MTNEFFRTSSRIPIIKKQTTSAIHLPLPSMPIFVKASFSEKATKFEKISHLFWQNSWFYSVVSKQVKDFFKFLWPFQKSWTLQWSHFKPVYATQMGRKVQILVGGQDYVMDFLFLLLFSFLFWKNLGVPAIVFNILNKSKINQFLKKI